MRARSLILTLMVLTSLSHAAATDDAASPATLVVPEGETVRATGILLVSELIVGGQLIFDAGEGNRIVAHSVSVLAEGRIVAESGARGADVEAPEAAAAPGANGGSIAIITGSFFLHDGARVVAGSGGAGGVAMGQLSAVGGAGGTGGSVVVWTQQADVQGELLAGRGGDGGDATVSVANDSQTPSIRTRAMGGSGGNSGVALVNNALWVSHSLAVAPPTALKPSPMSAPTLGGTQLTCATPQGRDGNLDLTGRGGDGGNACASSIGDTGSHGQPGNSGTFACSSGGPGGQGGNTVAGVAHAGNGGLGMNAGGNGGYAEADATGGDGGPGGPGGRKLGADCAGGPGGNGGSATGGTAVGGEGGGAICGHGGSGGRGSANAKPGKGGAGGSGDPPGAAGISGAATPGYMQAGNGGSGPGVCRPGGPDTPVPNPLGPIDIPRWLTPGGVPGLPQPCINRMSFDMQLLDPMVDPPVDTRPWEFLDC